MAVPLFLFIFAPSKQIKSQITMSYGILYRTMFIETERGIIPMIESGSNNVYEAARPNRRSRSWAISNNCKFGLFCTRESIKNVLNYESERLKEEREKARLSGKSYINPDGEYGYFFCIGIRNTHCNDTTFAMLKNFYMNGLKDMVSLEFAISYLGLRVGWYAKENHNLVRPNNVDEFWKIIDECENNKISEYTVYLSNRLTDDYYNTMKGVEQMVKGLSNKGNTKPYILLVNTFLDVETSYIGSNGRELFITKDKNKALILNKLKYNKIYPYDIVREFFYYNSDGKIILNDIKANWQYS